MKKKKRTTGSTQDNEQRKSDAGHMVMTREFVESLVVAIILALLFRAFESEAFVIPTGSMATTLLGRHKDVADEYTGYQYTVGSSREIRRETNQQVTDVVEAVDPLYHRLTSVADQPSYSGDRILVSKFAYDFSDPKRWDVIVFKYPIDPHVNYIKRLIGLPGETIRIYHGDIYVKKAGSSTFEIARKPAYKQLVLQSLVYDSKYRADVLEDAGFPERFEAYPSGATGWQKETDGGYSFKPDGNFAWLRYRHVLPDSSLSTTRYWAVAESGGKIDTQQAKKECSQLVTDFNSYNTYATREAHMRNVSGLHWVGDLCLESELGIESDSGVVTLDLVEGGIHYRCELDVATGKAKLFSTDENVQFDHEGEITGQTPIRGPGDYSIRFANADDELRLWVNGALIDFGIPVTFNPGRDLVPQWSESDPGDLLPAGIGSDTVAMQAKRLRVLRDVYYISDGSQYSHSQYAANLLDYDTEGHPGWNDPTTTDIRDVMASPECWSTSPLFQIRREAIFELAADQFFPLGDNSEHSLDGRLWPVGQQFVPRHMLIGKALFIYWPHSKNDPVPFFPTFSRMKFIR